MRLIALPVVLLVGDGKRLDTGADWLIVALVTTEVPKEMTAERFISIPILATMRFKDRLTEVLFPLVRVPLVSLPSW